MVFHVQNMIQIDQYFNPMWHNLTIVFEFFLVTWPAHV
jgi:hypothetical protein